MSSLINYDSKKTIGILGGMGPASSANIYEELINKAQKYYGAKQDYEFPPMILYSLPMHDWDTTGFLHMDSVKDQLIKGVRVLENAGCDLIIIGCNTVHHFYNEMQQSVSVPIINMVEETVDKVVQSGYKKVAVFSTDSTRRLGVYDKVLNRAGIQNTYLNSHQQDLVTRVIGNAEAGKLTDSDTKILKNLISEVKNLGAQAVILGCTEIPLAIKQSDTSMPLFNSALIISVAALETSYGFVNVKKVSHPNLFTVRSCLKLERLMASPAMSI